MAKALNVRTWADSVSGVCSFSPLVYGKTVNVCDALLSPDKKTWYYIKVGDKYGFINAGFVDGLPADKLIELLATYHKAIKHYGQLTENKYVAEIDTYKKAMARWEKNKTVYITCVVPLRWALYELRITRKGGKSLIAAVDGSFAGSFTGGVREKFKRITKGGPIGATTKAAIEKKLLKKGDIVCWKGITHTATYSGTGGLFYEGGGSCVVHGHYPDGILLDYTKNHYKNKEISEILRFK